MTQPQQVFRIDAVDHMTVEGDDGRPLLIVDRIVNPSGHWVLTVASGDDVELFQVHTVDSADGPRSPFAEHTVRISDASGAPLAEIAGDEIRVWGSPRLQ